MVADMLVHFNGTKYNIIPGERVLIDVRNVFSASPEGNFQPAMVVDVLSTQFTAELEDDHIVYRFYSDVGRSWRPV